MKRVAWIVLCILALVGCSALILLCVLLLTHGSGAPAFLGQLWSGPAPSPDRPRPYRSFAPAPHRVELRFDHDHVETTCMWVLDHLGDRRSDTG